MNKKKRAKFADVTNSFDPDDSSLHYRERLKGPKYADSPKTSEYAFFKKLKASSSHKEQIPLKKPESTSGREENNERVWNICKPAEAVDSLRSSCKLPTRNVVHDDYDLFLSPVNGAPKKLDVNRKDVSAFDFENICNFGGRSKQDGTYLRPKGSDAEGANMFSIKRQKLRQLVADNSFPEVDDLSSEGSGLISVLLRRLFPRSNLTNSSKLPEGRLVERNTNSQCLSSPLSDVQSRKIHELPARNMMELEFPPHFSSKLPEARNVRNTKAKCLSSPLSDVQFRKIHELPARNMMELELLPHLEGFPAATFSGGSVADVLPNFSSPISCAHNSHHQMKPRKLHADFGFSFPLEKYGCLRPYSLLQQLGDHHGPARTRTQSDFTFDYIPLEYGCLPSSSPPQETGNYHELTRSQHRKQLPLMLGWDSEVMPNDRSLTVTNTSSDFASSPSTISTLDDESQSFYTSGLHAPTALLDWPRERSSYTFYDNHECTGYLLGEEELKDADEPIPLAPSQQLSIPDLPRVGVGDIFLSSESYYNSIMHKIVGERQWSFGTETDTHYGLDAEWKHLYWSCPVRSKSAFSYHALPCHEREITPQGPFCEDEEDRYSLVNVSSYRRTFDHFREDTVGFFDRPSFDLQKTGVGEERGCRLLLYNSSWEETATLTPAHYHGSKIIHL